MEPRVLAGQLLVTGFRSAEAPRSYLDRLARGERAGAILFKRNLLGSPDDVARLTAELHAAAPIDLPVLVGVDQEGGRVARLGAPVLALPPMRTLADRLTLDDLASIAEQLARELASLGFSTAFSPVLDVDSNPDNPVIGDRSPSSDPARVAATGLAFARGLERGGLLACGKHFPGHGDTELDSHLALPRVRASRAELDGRELVPFVAAARASLPMLMTAHVVYDALDDARPATLSPRVIRGLLRDELAYDGVVVSDDLEMKALTAPVEESAIEAIAAGCDLLLICSDEELADRAHAALTAEIERSAAFGARALEAARRSLAMRRTHRDRARGGRLSFAELVATRARSESVVRSVLEARS